MRFPGLQTRHHLWPSQTARFRMHGTDQMTPSRLMTTLHQKMCMVHTLRIMPQEPHQIHQHPEVIVPWHQKSPLLPLPLTAVLVEHGKTCPHSQTLTPHFFPPPIDQPPYLIFKGKIYLGVGKARSIPTLPTSLSEHCKINITLRLTSLARLILLEIGAPIHRKACLLLQMTSSL